jgi:predicted DNA-binding protein
MSDRFLSVRIPKKLHDALKKHERDTMVPTSRFVRKLIECGLKTTEATELDGEVKAQ